MEASQPQYNSDENLIGFLFDVSGSMRSTYQVFQTKEYFNSNTNKDETRFQTVFNILNRIADIEEIQNSSYFSLAFGTIGQGQISDALELMQQYQGMKNLKQKHLQIQNNPSTIQDEAKLKIIYNFFLNNGAPNLPQFYSFDNAKEHFSAIEIDKLNLLVQQCPLVLKQFISSLPFQVRKMDIFPEDSLKQLGYNFLSKASQYAPSFVINKSITAQVFNLKKRIEFNNLMSDAFPIQLNEVLLDVNNICVLKVKNIKAIIQDGGKNLQINSKDILERMAYQSTPLREVFKLTVDFMKLRLNQKLEINRKNNILFVVSDGGSTDGCPIEFAQQLKAMGVIIVSCFITDSIQVVPNQLYSSQQDSWSAGAKVMFEISSELNNNEQPLRYLARNCSYKLSHTGKSRLFIQANHPQAIKDFFDQISKVRYDTDILLDVIGNIDLEPYISSSEKFQSVEQKGGTCYANAIAAVYYMAMKRIYMRKGGYPLFTEAQEIESLRKFPQNDTRAETKSYQNFDSIRDPLIEKFGKTGAVTVNVIKDTCKQYRLRYNEVNVTEAKDALNSGRPLVARFTLSEQQWEQFSSFYKKNPKGIADSFGPNLASQVESGHAVILIGYGKDHLKFLNSWGTKWGDQGTFKVKDANVLNRAQFFHIYWTLDDLLAIEKQSFKNNSAEIFRTHAQQFKDIYENIEYTCPICKVKSPIKSYSGLINEAKCPKCNKTFYPKALGETFINYLYGKDI